VNVAEIIDDLQHRGVRLSRRGDRLAVDAPKGSLTDTDRQQLVVMKKELLASLEHSSNYSAPEKPYRPVTKTKNREHWLVAYRELANLTLGIVREDSRFEEVNATLDLCDEAFERDNWQEFKQAAQAVKSIVEGERSNER